MHLQSLGARLPEAAMKGLYIGNTSLSGIHKSAVKFQRIPARLQRLAAQNETRIAQNKFNHGDISINPSYVFFSSLLFSSLLVSSRLVSSLIPFPICSAPLMAFFAIFRGGVARDPAPHRICIGPTPGVGGVGRVRMGWGWNINIARWGERASSEGVTCAHRRLPLFQSAQMERRVTFENCTKLARIVLEIIFSPDAALGGHPPGSLINLIVSVNKSDEDSPRGGNRNGFVFPGKF